MKRSHLYGNQSYQLIHKHKELEQEKIILDELYKFSNQRTRNLEQSIQQILKKLSTHKHTSSELEQEKEILQEINKSLEKRSAKSTSSYPLVFFVFLMIIVTSLIFFYIISLEQESITSPLTSRYVIENLRGDTVETWMSWKLAEGDSLTVNIINSDTISDEKLAALKETILSEESLEIDDSYLHKGPGGITSTYYVGWMGALNEASQQETEFYIPTKFNMIESKKGEGDIIISLSNFKDSDGYSGYTKSITDGNQILKSTITIYDVNNLSESQIATITRHELGHALGLAHSTAPEDLMYPVIETNFPYVSECDVDAIVSLYDGNESSEVICKK